MRSVTEHKSHKSPADLGEYMSIRFEDGEDGDETFRLWGLDASPISFSHAEVAKLPSARRSFGLASPGSTAVQRIMNMTFSRRNT